MVISPTARVLVVDDEADLRRLYSEVLTDEGYQVREAPNGADALAVAQQWHPDVILLDLMMPVMNGWQFAEAYGALPDANARVIVITAAGPGAIRSASSLGVIASVLSKPLNIETLLELVGYHTQHH